MLIEKSFYFARHGESEHNERGICAGGKTDSPLTAKGIAQAHSLKDKLIPLGIDHVISSPMIRAKRTAEIAGGRPPLIDENLREIDLGVFEDKPVNGIVEYMIDLPYHLPVPGGESKFAFTTKITDSFNRWLSTYEGNLLFVAHGFVYGTLLTILGMPLRSSDLELKNSALVHFHHNGICWKVTPLS